MSTIFSPSACSWKPSNPQGKGFFHSESKSTVEGNELRTSSSDYSQRRSISFWWHTSICSLVNSSERCRAFPYLDTWMRFAGSARSAAPADWSAWSRLSYSGGTPPPRHALFFLWAVRSPARNLIHPVCTHKEPDWQGHSSSYFAKVAYCVMLL